MNKAILPLLFCPTLTLAWDIYSYHIENDGLIGSTGEIQLITDQAEGGSSKVYDPQGNCIGSCGGAQGDSAMDFSPLLNPGLNMQFEVQNFIPSSASNWGYAYAGVLFVPIVNSDTLLRQAPLLQKAMPMGITANSTLTWSFAYSKDKTLSIELVAPPKADGSPGYEDSTHGVPRTAARGTGSCQVLTKSVGQIKYSWGSGSPDYSKAVGIAFKRIVAAGSLGAEFPSNEAASKTWFSFGMLSTEGQVLFENDLENNYCQISTELSPIEPQPTMQIHQGLWTWPTGTKAQISNLQGQKYWQSQGEESYNLQELHSGLWILQSGTKSQLFLKN